MKTFNTNKFNFISASIAFVLWGSWAYYINNSGNSGIISGIAQGLASFVITICMIHIVTWFFNYLPKTSVTLILPSVLTICITGSALFIVHFLVGTPRILHTIWLPLTIAFIFCLFVTIKLKKLS